MFSRWPRYLQPGPGRRDVVGGALAGRLDQHGKVEEVLPVPRREGFEQLQAVARRVDGDLDPRAVGGRRDETALARGEASVGELLADGDVEGDGLALLVGERVGPRVELDGAGQRERHDRLGGGDEGQRAGEAVVALGEVAVVRGDDGVGVALVHVGPGPLPDARAAGVGQHGGADAFEVGQQAVALDRGADLLAARCDHQLGAAAQPRGGRLTGDAGRPGDVLVARVGARADEGGADLDGPSLGPGLGAEGRNRSGPVRGVGPVDQRLEGGEIDLDDLVEEPARVGAGPRRRRAGARRPRRRRRRPARGRWP